MSLYTSTNSIVVEIPYLHSWIILNIIKQAFHVQFIYKFHKCLGFIWNNVSYLQTLKIGTIFKYPSGKFHTFGLAFRMTFFLFIFRQVSVAVYVMKRKLS